MRQFRTFCSLQFTRSIYIPSGAAKQSSNAIRRPNRTIKSRLATAEAEREAQLLDEQLNEIKARQQELRDKIAADNERIAQEKLIQEDISTEASNAEINLLESQLASPPSTSRTKTQRDGIVPIIDAMPNSIQNVLKESEARSNKQDVTLFSRSPTTWSNIIPKLPILEGVPASDVFDLMARIPVKQRAFLVPELERIVPLSIRTQQINDSFMACYAELAQPKKVEELLNQCEEPSIFSYGHLSKAFFKSGAEPEDIIAVTKRMKDAGVQVNLPIMSTLIQSFIQNRRHEDAIELFDSMKYWSVGTQPDLKLYNTMILCYAKQFNVNKCLDLFSEMRNRRPYPLEPNEETYNNMIYALSRDPKTHVAAWNFFIELQQSGYSADKNSFRALMYLCGSSGEVLLARALVRKLSDKSPLLIDDYAVNCLLKAYSNWHPGPSKILGSSAGPSIRASIMAYSGDFDAGNWNGLPLLPTAQMTPEIVLAESNSVFEYFAEVNIGALVVQNKASKATIPSLHSYLKVAMNMSTTIDEFKRRFDRFTEYAGENDNKILPAEEEDIDYSVSPDERSKEIEANRVYSTHAKHPNLVVKRDNHLYRLSIKAAIKFGDLTYGKEIWMERGKWRRLPAFRELPQNVRNDFDFQFAQDVVELLAVCGQTNEAITLVESSKNLKKWKKHHLSTLINKCEEAEDTASIAKIFKIIRSYRFPKTSEEWGN